MATRIEPAFVGLSKPEEDFFSETSWLWKYFAVKECRQELHREHAFPKLDKKIINLEKNAILYEMEKSKKVSEHVWSFLKDNCAPVLRRKLRDAFLRCLVKYCRELRDDNAKKDEIIANHKMEIEAERQRVLLTVEQIREDAATYVKIKALLDYFSNDLDDEDTKVARRKECLEDIEQMLTSNKELRNRMAILDKEIKFKHDEKEALESQFKDLKGDFERLQKENESLQKEKRELDEMNEDMQKSHVQLKWEIRQMMDEHKQNIKKMIAQHNEDREIWKKELQKEKAKNLHEND